MKKNNRKKLLALMMALALIVGCTVGSTLAWLIIKTEPVVNTFTVGNIDIVLQEHVVDPVTGKIDETKGFTAKGNEGIKLMPGREIDKDPTVTVRAGSERCYVRMYMILDYPIEVDSEFVYEDTKDWFNIGTSWKANEYLIDSVNHNNLGHILEYYYSDVVDISNATEDEILEPLFTKITVPTDLEDSQFESLANCKIIIVAQAVQAEGFYDEDEDVLTGAVKAFSATERPKYVDDYIKEKYVKSGYVDLDENGKILGYPIKIISTDSTNSGIDEGGNSENE